MLEIVNACLAISSLLILPLCLGLGLYFYKYKYLIEITSNIPSPPTWPIIGHAHHFIGQPPHRNIAIFTEFVEKYGNTMKIWLGPELNMFFSDIKDVEIVLASMRFNDKADEYLSLEPWLREGLLVSRGQKWHKRRKAITPAFHFKSLDDFIEIFERESRVFLANMDREWRRQSVNGVDLYEWVNLCTLDTICGKSI
ncbi:cytochrome P450 4d1-like [Lucilia cuprina]|uniref:cytochrome P450 4d1-like n=1 Tax=Lucilia cuprina TaxID=7375 RepID=UPI001F06B106|nr:cytochrome P450 4d1-like [Lucilia cuprina]